MIAGTVLAANELGWELLGIQDKYDGLLQARSSGVSPAGYRSGEDQDENAAGNEHL